MVMDVVLHVLLKTRVQRVVLVHLPVRPHHQLRVQRVVPVHLPVPPHRHLRVQRVVQVLRRVHLVVLLLVVVLLVVAQVLHQVHLVVVLLVDLHLLEVQAQVVDDHRPIVETDHYKDQMIIIN